MKQLLFAAVLLAACGGPPKVIVVGHPDLSGVDDNRVDMAPPAGDFATLPFDMRAWNDETVANVVPDGGELSGVWNTTSTAIAVGDNASVLRKERGGKWVSDTTTKPSGVALIGIGGVGTSAVYVGGNGGALWAYSGAEWTGSWMPDSPPATENPYRSFWVAPDGLAFGEADDLLVVRKTDGAFSWTALPGVPSTTEYPDCVWGLPTTNPYSVYFGGCLFNSSTGKCTDARIWHSDGNTVSAPQTIPTTTSCQIVYGIWAASATDIYAVCNAGVILHSTGDGNWVTQNSPISNGYLYSISGANADEIYIVGSVDGSGQPIVLHKYSHATDVWVRDTLPSSVKNDLYSVYATPYDVFAVGYNGQIIHK